MDNKSAAEHVGILEDSLIKKIDLLRQIRALNEEQKVILEK